MIPTKGKINRLAREFAVPLINQGRTLALSTVWKRVQTARRRRLYGGYVFHFLQVSEGGPAGGQRAMIATLRSVGIDACPIKSYLVGHTAVMVFGNSRIQGRARKLIFGL